MNPRNIAFACVVFGSLASLSAATYNQTTFNPATTTWNGAAIWGGNAVTAGNDYQLVAGPSSIETTFNVTVGGVTTAWQTWAQVRDYGGSGLPSGPSTFGGDRLLIADKTRFLSKGRNTTTTANFVMANGGFMFLSAGGASTDGPGTATWAGTIATSGNTLIGLEANNNTNVSTLNVTAPISGSGLLTLTGKGAQSGFLNLKGDISAFTGTFLLSSATNKTVTALTFSIANSASFATLQLNYSSPFFHYDLSTNNVSFASLILTNSAGTNNLLGAGIYDAATLNGLTGNAGIFTGIGSITVIPESSSYAFGLLGVIAMVVARRRWKQSA